MAISSAGTSSERVTTCLVARMLMGSIQSYVFFEIVLRTQQKMPLPVEEYLRGLINVLWTGVEPAPRKGH